MNSSWSRFWLFMFAVAIGMTVWIIGRSKSDSAGKNTRTLYSLFSSRSSESSVPSLNLGWNEGGPTIVDYVLHWGPASGQYDSNQHVGLVNATSVPYPTAQTFYAVSGVDANGLESLNSNEIAVGPLAFPSPTPSATATATATVPPVSPTPTSTATATPTATVGPDFVLVTTPPVSRTVTVNGGSPSFGVKMTTSHGFDKAVMLSRKITLDGMPLPDPVCYIETKISSQPLNGVSKSTTVTVFVTAEAPPGTYVVTITGNSCTPPLSRSTQCTVVKPGP